MTGVSRSRGIRAKRWNHDPAAQSGELNNCALHFQRKEIIRCLKRYVARDIYRRLVGVDEQQKHPLSRPPERSSGESSFKGWRFGLVGSRKLLPRPHEQISGLRELIDTSLKGDVVASNDSLVTILETRYL